MMKEGGAGHHPLLRVRQGTYAEGIAEVEVRELGSESGHGEPVPSLHPPEAPLLAEVEFGATQ